MLVIPTLTLLMACGATMVTGSSDLGGIQDGPKWGVVRYLNQGIQSVVDARKADARRQMADYCRPTQYRVTETNEKDKWEVYISEGWGGGGSMSYMYIRFECVDTAAE